MTFNRLLILALGVVFLYSLMMLTADEKETSYYDTQKEAYDLMNDAMELIKEERLARGIEIDDSLDPLQTGMIGKPFPHFDTPGITTTLGFLESKQLSVNANFAALMVHYFHKAGLSEGDTVAINFSGSFPAFNIATLSAVEIMGLDPLIASSIGASTYGANMEEFTYIDMERHVYEKGLFSHRSTWVSLGGTNDQLGQYADNNLRTELLERYRALDYEIIDDDNLEHNIQNRYRAYHDAEIGVRLFVNSGGNMVSYGKHLDWHPNGLTRRMSVSVTSGSGLIERFPRDDIPVVHMLDVRDLVQRYDMSTSVDEPYEFGIGTMFYEIHYSPPIAYVGVLGTATFVGVDRYQRSRKRV